MCKNQAETPLFREFNILSRVDEDFGFCLAAYEGTSRGHVLTIAGHMPNFRLLRCKLDCTIKIVNCSSCVSSQASTVVKSVEF